MRYPITLPKSCEPTIRRLEVMSRTATGSNGKKAPRAPEQPAGAEAHGERRQVSPFRCRVWTQHSRPEEQLTEQACKSLRESIAKNGQHQPALGRPVTDDPDYEVEIICGARRHAAALALGRDLLVEVRKLSDAEAYVAMYEENVLREDDSPYARGQILCRALRSSTYPSQEELGRAFNLSHSAVSRLLALAQLPSIIVAAFRSPDDIREAWGVELFRMWSNKTMRDGITARARAVASKPQRPPAREIYETLTTASGGLRKTPRLYRDIPIRGSSDTILFHEQDQLERVLYIIPKRVLSPNRREALKRWLVRVLEDDTITLPLEAPGDASRGARDPSHTTRARSIGT